MENLFCVNYTELVDGEHYHWISEYSKDQYTGKTVDTVYLDGCDTTDWGQFVGTHEECEAYIKEIEK